MARIDYTRSGAAGDVKAVSIWGDRMIFRVTGEDTGGAYAVLEYIAGPGSGSPRHVHHNEDESFYILDGAMTFDLGDGTVKAEAGAFVSIPKEMYHAFGNREQEPVRCLVILYPAGLEHFFEELAEMAREHPEGPPRDAFLALADKYNVDFRQ
jgi:quercetin dioxygenase-like cupin family protein